MRRPRALSEPVDAHQRWVSARQPLLSLPTATASPRCACVWLSAAGVGTFQIASIIEQSDPCPATIDAPSRSRRPSTAGSASGADGMMDVSDGPAWGTADGSHRLVLAPVAELQESLVEPHSPAPLTHPHTHTHTHTHRRGCVHACNTRAGACLRVHARPCSLGASLYCATA